MQVRPVCLLESITPHSRAAPIWTKVSIKPCTLSLVAVQNNIKRQSTMKLQLRRFAYLNFYNARKLACPR